MANQADARGGFAASARAFRVVAPSGPQEHAFAGRYRLGRVLGTGGVSIVLEALDTQSGKTVAVKLLTTSGHVSTERFIREAKVAYGLRSEHVVEVLDAGVDGDQPFIVMERLVGIDVGKLLADHGPQSPQASVDIVLQTCDALARAHGAGIVHRDIKASNLFLHDGPEGPVLKVLDFGISKVWSRSDGEHTLTAHDGALLGSPPYMSPEQIRDPRSVDARTDIWSMGVVLYRLLSGRFPFCGESTASMLAAILQAPFTALGASLAPPELEAIVARCLERQLDARFSGVAELAAALSPFASPRFRHLAARIARTSSSPRIATREGGLASVTALASRRLRAREPNTMTVGTTPSSLTMSRRSAPGSVAHTVSAQIAAVRTLTTPSLSASWSVVAGEHGERPSAPAPAPAPALTVSSRAPLVLAGTVAAIAAVVVAVTLALGWRGLPLRGGRVALAAGTSGASAVSTAAASPQATVAPAAPRSCPEGMVRVEGGRFFMGSDEDLPAEKPAHHVSLGAYCIDKREVTAGAYKACSDRGDCKRAGTSNKWEGLTPKLARTFDPLCNGQAAGRGSHPINCVDWFMADRFCKAEGKRLPTEAEWEFAARGSDGRRYPWGDATPSPRHLNACGPECVLWLGRRGEAQEATLFGASDGWPTTAPVGSFPLGAAASGAEDMVGNVWEWTADWYDSYEARDLVDPQGPATGKTRVIRGGAWNGAYTDWVRPSFRFHDAPGLRSHGIGLRCATSL